MAEGPPDRDQVDQELNRLGESMINQLFMLIRTLRMHNIENEAFSRPLESLKETINQVINLAGQAKLVGVGKDIYLNENRIRVRYRNMDCATFIVEQLALRNIGELSFPRHVEVPELKRFLSLFSKDLRDDPHAAEQVKNSLQGITLGSFRKLVDDFGDAQLIDKRKYALRVYTRAVLALKTYVEELNKGEMPPTRRLLRVVQELCDIAAGETNFVLGLVSIKRDGDSLYHQSVNATLLAAGLAQRLGLPRYVVADVAMAAYLHDIGMAAVPQELLDKPGKLTDEERAQVSRHVLITIRQLLKSGGFERSRIKQMVVAYEHHLRFDGADRPHREMDIDFLSQMVAVADTYVALTADKPWRKAFRPDEALRQMLSDAGKKFDPLLIKSFVNLVGVFPVGTVVTLSTGEVALVFMNTEQPDRPVVKLLLTADWGKPGPLRHYDLSEIDETGEYVRTIVGAVSAEEHGINVAKALLE